MRSVHFSYRLIPISLYNNPLDDIPGHIHQWPRTSKAIRSPSSTARAMAPSTDQFLSRAQHLARDLVAVCRVPDQDQDQDQDLHLDLDLDR